MTCFYSDVGETSPVQKLQSTGMISDFYVGLLVAWLLDGVKFALGPTIATTRAHLGKFGGYEVLENRPADDLLVGRLIAESGQEVVLLPYAVRTVADFQSLSELVYKRLRWLVVMRNMRPWGHLGLFDEPVDDLPTFAELLDRAIEDLYGCRRRVGRAPREGPSYHPDQGGRIPGR